MDYTVLAWDSPQLYAQVKNDFFSGMIISVCCTVCLLIASLVWFHGWEAVSYTHLDVYKRQPESMRKTKYIVKPTTQFKKDFKLAMKRSMKIELLEEDGYKRQA